MKSRLRFQVMAFTAVRTVLNTMQRMVYPFLAVFARGLGVDLSSLTLALTFRSVAGAFGPFVGSVADSRGRKFGMLFGLFLFIVGVGVVAIWPTFPAFLVALILAMLGKYVFDPSMQAYLGDRVAYQRRGRVLAITEFSWSLSFIIGAPVMGFLIARRGWQAPFPALALLGVLAFGLLAWMLPTDPARGEGSPGLFRNLGRVFSYPPAVIGLVMSLLISAGNEVVNVVFGVWMEASFNARIAALGATAVVLGLAELGGETFTALFTDRLGKARAITIGLALNCLAALALPYLGRSQAGAVTGLFLFYLSFEFTIVSSIPLMTEVFPAARATLMAGNIASHSLGRALGALVTYPLYAYGTASPGVPDILPSALAAVGFNVLGWLALSRLRRAIGDQR